jgi:hypothetical protein
MTLPNRVSWTYLRTRSTEIVSESGVHFRLSVMVLDQADKGILVFLCDPGRIIGSEEKVIPL